MRELPVTSITLQLKSRAATAGVRLAFVLCSLACLFPAGANAGLVADEPVSLASPAPAEPAASENTEASGPPVLGPELGRQTLLRRLPRPRRFMVSSDTEFLYD